MRSYIQLPPTPTKIKILAVDDREDNLLALEVALQDCNYEIHMALSGEKAVQLTKENDYAAILMDVQMPVMDGFATAMRIRCEQRSKNTPIIFVTAIHRSERQEKLGYIAGAVDYLFKPISVEILKAKLGVFADLFYTNAENRRQAQLLSEAVFQRQENIFLKEAVNVREEFISMAAHELKTPLTPLNLQMQFFSKMYDDGSIEKVPLATLQRMIRTSVGQVERLNHIVSELLDVSSLNAGHLQIKPAPMDLNLLIDDVLATFQSEISRAKCEITKDFGLNMTGYWDRFRIEQVIINLLTNALKYGEGKPIEIRTFRQDGNAYFTIRDHGIGIAEEDHQRIFERFERAVSSKNYGGLGLGLYIACRVVRLHKGDIRVQSRLNEGAEFIVDLPLGQESA